MHYSTINPRMNCELHEMQLVYIVSRLIEVVSTEVTRFNQYRGVASSRHSQSTSRVPARTLASVNEDSVGHLSILSNSAGHRERACCIIHQWSISNLHFYLRQSGLRRPSGVDEEVEVRVARVACSNQTPPLYPKRANWAHLPSLEGHIDTLYSMFNKSPPATTTWFSSSKYCSRTTICFYAFPSASDRRNCRYRSHTPNWCSLVVLDRLALRRRKRGFRWSWPCSDSSWALEGPVPLEGSLAPSITSWSELPWNRHSHRWSRWGQDCKSIRKTIIQASHQRLRGCCRWSDNVFSWSDNSLLGHF